MRFFEGSGLPGLFKSNQEKDSFLSETKQAGASRGLLRCFENFWKNKSKFCSFGIAFFGQGRTLRAPVYAPPQPTEGDPSVSKRLFVRGPHADGATERPTTAIEEETSLQEEIFLNLLYRSAR